MIEEAVGWVFSILNLPESQTVGILKFFLTDVIKIILLLFGMIWIIGVLRSYLSQEKIKSFLSGKRLGFGNLLASLLGSLTPFCSCSSIPIFFGFLHAGVPLGVTFSFLITSPLINEYLVVLMLGFFGWKITAVYILSGIFLGTLLGIVLGRMGLEKYLEKDLSNAKSKDIKFSLFKERVSFGFDEAKSITGKIWLWVIAGVGLGAVIHNYVPQEFVERIISAGGIFTVPIAAILGVPMYGSCAAIVPIALALFQKGVPLGTSLAFMMATSALSLPEAVILRRAMKFKLIAVFFGVVALGIVAVGYLVNFLQPLVA